MRRRLALHLSFWILGAAVIRVGVVPAEVCPGVDIPQVEASIDAAAQWITRNIRDDGRYLYGYDRGADDINGAYNAARHGGVTMSLYQTALWYDPSYADDGDIGLRVMLDGLIERDGWQAWRPDGQDVPLGANSLFLAALTYRRDVTGDTSLDDTMRSLARFLVAQQQPDGGIFAYYDPNRNEAIPVYGIFATGEASWALARMERQFPGEGWGEAASLTLDHLATERDAAVGRLTRLPDHWAAYTVGEFAPSAIDEVQLEYARDLAGFFGIRLRFEAQRRGDGLNLALRWFPGPPAGVGTAGEGLGALWRLSAIEDRLADLRPAMEERLLCTAGFMIERQVAADEAAAYARPELVEGAWFYRGYTQMDDQQHVLSTLLSALQVLEARS